MNNYYELELDILSCLIQRPEYMKSVILEDKHFKKYHNLWQFMKAFYNRYGNFDLVLMTSVVKNKNNMIKYIMLLIEREPAPSNFYQYQQELIKMYNEPKKEQYIIYRINQLINDLNFGQLKVNDFKLKLDGVLKDAEERFGE